MFDLKDMVLHLVTEANSLEEMEKKVAEAVFELGRALLKAVYEHLDEKLSREREKGLRNLGMRKRDVLTRFGVIAVRRRYYRDREGKHRFLLDEALGWDKGGLALSPTLEGEVLRMASETSFRRASGHLSFFLAQEVDHNLLHRRVRERGSERAEEKRKRAQDLFLRGALPPAGKRRAPRLFMEADGCLISTQRRGGRKHELRVGISYEGWSRLGEGKWKTDNRRVFLSASDGATFLSQWSADLATVYDPCGVSEIIWSSDGASWLRKAPDLFSSTFAQLSRFHLKRTLTRALGFSGEAERLYLLACEGRAREVISELERHLEGTAEENKRKRIAEAISYLSSLSGWLSDWRSVLEASEDDRSPGAIEGNVDKLASDRFKKRGMSWSPKGADSMCQIVELKENGELSTFLLRKRRIKEREEKKVLLSLRREVRRDPEAWLRKHMPVLEARSGDPWVKEVLRGLAGYSMIA